MLRFELSTSRSTQALDITDLFTQRAWPDGLLLVSVEHTTAAIFLGESEQDRFGACLAALGDVNGDGTPDILIGAPGFDPDDFPFGSGHGAAYLFALTSDIWP